MKHKGFTLIELVTVIVLLGILAAVAVPRFINVQDQAREAQRAQLRAQISSAINMNVAKKIAEGKPDPIPDPAIITLEDLLNEIPEGLVYNSGTFTYESGDSTYTMTYQKNPTENTWKLSDWTASATTSPPPPTTP